VNENAPRSLYGILGTLAGFTLENINTAAALAASLATAVYMAFCAVEKFRVLRGKAKPPGRRSA
jgi:hypothetical protein